MFYFVILHSTSTDGLCLCLRLLCRLLHRCKPLSTYAARLWSTNLQRWVLNAALVTVRMRCSTMHTLLKSTVVCLHLVCGSSESIWWDVIRPHFIHTSSTSLQQTNAINVAIQSRFTQVLVDVKRVCFRCQTWDVCLIYLHPSAHRSLI